VEHRPIAPMIGAVSNHRPHPVESVLGAGDVVIGGVSDGIPHIGISASDALGVRPRRAERPAVAASENR